MVEKGPASRASFLKFAIRFKMSQASNFRTLKALLKRFSPEDLENSIPTVTGIRWSNVSKRLTENKLAFNRNNIAEIVVTLYQGRNPSKDVIANACGKLQLFDVVSNNKIHWQCKKLECRQEDFPEVEDLEKRLVRAFKREAKDVEVKIYEDEPLVFVMCKEMTQKRNVKSYKSPVFFVIDLNLDEQYFFHSKLNETTQIYLSFICDALNYERCSVYPLEGEDVRNMFEMISRDQSGIEIENIDFNPVVRQEGKRLDFTQGRARMEYALKKFPGLTNLKSFTVHARNTWTSEASDEEESVSVLTFTAKRNTTIEDGFRYLIKENLVSIPLPPYMDNLTKIPKNDVNLESNSNWDTESE